MTNAAARLGLAFVLAVMALSVAACSAMDATHALKQPTPTSQNPAHQQHFPRP